MYFIVRIRNARGVRPETLQPMRQVAAPPRTRPIVCQGIRERLDPTSLLMRGVDHTRLRRTRAFTIHGLTPIHDSRPDPVWNAACAAWVRTFAAASASAVSRTRRAAASFLRVAASASRSAVSTASWAVSSACARLGERVGGTFRFSRCASGLEFLAPRFLVGGPLRANGGGDGLLRLGQRLRLRGILRLRSGRGIRSLRCSRCRPRRCHGRSGGKSGEQFEPGWLQDLGEAAGWVRRGGQRAKRRQDRLFGRVGCRLPGVAKDGKRRLRDGLERLFVRFAGGAQVRALS